MIKGTDLIIGIQVLIVQHKNCQGLHFAVNADDKLNQDFVIRDFLKTQMAAASSLKEELQQLLVRLGNASDHFNMDNLNQFIKEKHMPNLDLDRISAKIFKSLKKQYVTLIESYKKILSFKGMPILVESVMLRHLAELQGAASYLIHLHTIPTAPKRLTSNVELNKAV